MPKIHFTSSPKIPFDKLEDWGKYVLGSIHDVTNDEMERWIRRGVAEQVTTRQANVILKEIEGDEEEVVVKEAILTPEVIPASPPEIKVEENKVEPLSSPTVRAGIAATPRR